MLEEVKKEYEGQEVKNLNLEEEENSKGQDVEVKSTWMMKSRRNEVKKMPWGQAKFLALRVSEEVLQWRRRMIQT